MLLWWSHLKLRKHDLLKNSNQWNHSDRSALQQHVQAKREMLFYSFHFLDLRCNLLSSVILKRLFFLIFVLWQFSLIKSFQKYKITAKNVERFARRPHYAIAASFYRLMDERGKLPRRQNVSRGQKLHPWISNIFHHNLRGGCVVLVGANTAKTYCNTTVDKVPACVCFVSHIIEYDLMDRNFTNQTWPQSSSRGRPSKFQGFKRESYKMLNLAEYHTCLRLMLLF